MAKFNMDTLVKLADIAVANAMVAKEKNQKYHHNLLLKKVIAAGEAGMTCAALAASLEAEKAAVMEPAGVATWDKYSASCHLSYFVNRCRGAVTATVDGVAIAQGPTKAKKAAKPAEVQEAAPVAEVKEEVAEVKEEVAVATEADTLLAAIGVEA